MDTMESKSDEPMKLPFELLKEITNNFDIERRLGKGTSGEVYKGVFKDGKVIAVKKLHFMPQSDDKQFQNEFIHLTRLKHQNIVQLVGFCDEEEDAYVPHEGKMVHAVYIHKALCLEFVPNGGLGKFISEKYLELNWQTRFRIIQGTCQGLNYLHEHCTMHFDLKPDNILVDEKMMPKIADFGLSRLLGEENTIMTKSSLGTIGYLPPEFIKKQIISKAYDIFSLGVIIKRIVTGMDYWNIDMDDPEFIEHVQKNWRKRLQDIPDYASLERDCKQVRTCIEIAVDCTQEDPHKRPKMNSIIRRLSMVENKENDSEFHDGQFFLPVPERPSPEFLGEIHTSELALEFLREITNDFSTERIVSQHAFGTVFKGILRSGEEIAVNRFGVSCRAAPKNVFQREIRSLMWLKHENVLRLIGFCYEKKVVKHDGRYILADEVESYLCHEYAQRGSLDKYIYDESFEFDWNTRFKIIIGICEGLHFLHTELGQPIIDTPLAPEDILLDSNMVPKLSDVGVSNLFDKLSANRMCASGYMAPEHKCTGEISSVQSDIYRLGLLIMQIATGLRERPSRTEHGLGLVHEVRTWENEFVQTRDRSIDTSGIGQFQLCIQTALNCTRLDKKERPSIQEIVKTLKYAYLGSVLDEDITSSSIASRYGLISSPHRELLSAYDNLWDQEWPLSSSVKGDAAHEEQQQPHTAHDGFTQLRVLKYTRYEMLNKALEVFGDLRDDEELGPTDWTTVKKYITCLNNLEDEQAHPHDVPDRDDHVHAMNLKDTRVRLLNGVQAAYWGMLEEGRITQYTSNILMRSVDEAMDLVSSQSLCDWKGLRSIVHFPNYYRRFFQISRLPRKLVTYFTAERLELGCYICAAFLRAHRIARRQLHDFLGDSEIARIVIDESTAAGEEAKKFLEDVRVTFPQVLRALKTRQVTYAVLTHLSEYIQDLGKTGLLEEKEIVHLDDALQTDLKKLQTNPPQVKMPTVRELLNTHPLVGALPAAVHDPLLSNTKETIKGHGTILYTEGSRPTGIWLVSTGIVKWTSQRLCTRHSLDPILSHGSTLGLYEALIGKPYICDIITESVVHCFFIEAEKIEQLRQCDPSIEDFMWQESALVIARILLPQIFEKMAMREMRFLISERSSMNSYFKGEDIELGHNYIGILLEGFLKTNNQILITPPAMLLPPNTDLNLFGLQYSAMNHIDYCYTAPSYQVEARARAILFEIGRLDIEADLQRSASLLSPTLGPSRTQSKEHVGLLRWPESFRRSSGPGNASLVEIRSQPGSFSARALQVSMYGSMTDGMHRARRQPRLAHVEGNQKHSVSYPKVPSRAANTRSLLSVRSEGSNVMNRKSAPAPAPAIAPALAPFPPPLAAGRQRRAVGEDDYSSDESVGEEVIVRVDSPSMLSFNPPFGPPRGS